MPRSIKTTFGILLALSACEAELPSEDEYASNASALAAAFGTDLPATRPWNSNSTINTCFIGPDGGLGNVPRKNRLWSALQGSWPRATSLNFSDQGVCPSNSLVDAGWMAVYLPDDDLCGGIATYGMNSYLGALAVGVPNARPDINIRMCGWADDPDGGTHLEHAFVHEVGHSLGFYHEEERDDDNCQPESNRTDGHLTIYDPYSVMTNCVLVTYQEPPFMSALDALGAEMLYPHSNSGQPIACESACFETSSGVVIASNGLFTIGFIRRGGIVPDPMWVWPGGTQAARSIGASQLSDGAHNVSATWPSARAVLQPTLFSGETMSASGVAVKSDSEFAALVMIAAN